MRKGPAIGVVVGVLLLGWAISKVTGSRSKEPVPIPGTESQFEVVGSGSGSASADAAAGAGAGATGPVVNGQGLLVAPIKEKPAAPAKPELPFEFKKELDVWSELNKRLFLSESDLAEKRRLLNDIALLRGLGLRLTEPSISKEVVENQDSAVDLLIEAVKSGDREAASDVLKSVVQDSQIENPSMDKAVREHMAGVKAEIMLRWAALVPDEVATIERSLPGPVSQKIWDNVKKRHASNLSESGR